MLVERSCSSAEVEGHDLSMRLKLRISKKKRCQDSACIIFCSIDIEGVGGKTCPRVMEVEVLASKYAPSIYTRDFDDSDEDV